jgi:hypothetical protein
MATYFVGTGLESFAISPTLVTDTPGNGLVIGMPAGPGYADAYLTDPATGQRSPQTALWAHFEMTLKSIEGETVSFINAAGVPVFRMFATNNIVFCERWTGDAWARLGDGLFAGDRHTYDFRLVSHVSAGRISVNVDGTNWIEMSGLDTSDFGPIARMRFKAPRGLDNWGTYYYQTIIASYNTIGHTVRVRVPSSDVQAGWNGGYAAIDDANNDDTDSISTALVGVTSTFGAASLSPTAVGNVIKAVAVSARIRNDGGDVPRNAQAVLTLDGVDYSPASNLVVGPGFNGASQVFDINPATGQKWASIAEVNQPFGLKSTA